MPRLQQVVLAWLSSSCSGSGHIASLTYTPSGTQSQFCITSGPPTDELALRLCEVETARLPSELWRLDGNGLLVSHASGRCISVVDSTVQQESCSSTSWRWSWNEGGKLESIESGECLSVSNGSLVLCDCEGFDGAWRMEAATLVTYPGPSGVSASPHYQVDVSQDGQVQSSFVYYSEPQNGEPLAGKSRSWTTFSFDGSVIVKVTKLQGSFSRAILRPLESPAEVVGMTSNTFSFKLTEPNTKLSVEFDADWETDNLLIFADELERNIPAVHAEGVQYFSPGMHQTNLMLTSNTVVYVAGGAYVTSASKKDNIFATAVTSSKLRNITIRGRGVISGEASFRHSGSQPFPVTLCGSDHRVEGVTVIDAPQQSHLQINAPWFCDSEWTGTATGARIHNIKVMGWNFADGIYSGKRSHVSNVFTKVNDDGVKPFEGDTLYENNVHWQEGNGWAIMLSWLTEGHQSNITVRDSVIIHDGHDSDWSVSGCDPCRNNQASIGAVHGGSGLVSNVLIENVVIESPVLRPVWIGVEKSTWGTSGQGKLDGITLRNVRVLEPAQQNSEIVDFSPSSVQVSNIKFEGFEYNGVVAQSQLAAHVLVLNSPENVEFYQSSVALV